MSTLEMKYRAPGQRGLTEISITHNGAKGFTIAVDTVPEKPGDAHLEGYWKLDAIMPAKEPVAWAEIDVLTGELLDVVRFKPEQETAGLRYEPLFYE